MVISGCWDSISGRDGNLFTPPSIMVLRSTSILSTRYKTLFYPEVKELNWISIAMLLLRL